jgi:hypothetical protein
LRHATLALGLNNHGNVLSTEELGQAINFERQRVQRFLSSHPQRKHDFIACVAYNDYQKWNDFAHAHGLEGSIIFHSAQEDLSCRRLTLSSQNLGILSSDNLPVYMKLFEPIPSLSKLDSSLHQVMLHINGENRESLSHPIIAHIIDKEAIALDIYFRSKLSSRRKQNIHSNWLQQLSTPDKLERKSGINWLEGLSRSSVKVQNRRDRHEYNDSGGGNNKDGVFYSQNDPFPELQLFARPNHRSVLDVWQDFAPNIDTSRTVATAGELNTNEYGDHNSVFKLCNVAAHSIDRNSTADLLVSSVHNHGIRLHLPLSIYDAQDSKSLGNCFAALLNVILEEEEVLKVALTSPPKLQNNNARGIVQTGSIGSEIYINAGLNGTSIIVGVSDTGIDEMSCFFKDHSRGKVPRSSVEKPYTDTRYRKVVQYISYSGSSGDYSDGHGSHVSGSIAGHCSSTSSSTDTSMNAYQGMAPAAQLAFFDIGMNVAAQWLAVPDDLSAELFPPAYSAGARIHSNSWGGGYFFDAYSIDTDAYLYSHDDFAVFFAAGNSGMSGLVTVISPSLAKNAISVGCTGNMHSGNQKIDYIAPFSANGPSIDGRLKPDIVAPGYSVYSARARSENNDVYTCETTSKMGTSMATPVAAGNAALIKDYFNRNQYWYKYCNKSYRLCRTASSAISISGVMLKALVLHSGQAVSAYDGSSSGRGLVSSHVPDIYQGYGRMTLANILPLQFYSSSSSSSFDLYIDEASLASLSERVYEVDVEDSNRPLKVTLSWYDPPNDIFAARLLLHDLDLLLESPQGVIYHANQPAVTVSSVSDSGNRDELNNNEQITIKNPGVGKWKVFVQAKQLTESDLQKYALVITQRGAVVEPTETLPISWSLLQKCSSTNSANYEVDLSLWSRIDHNGWDGADSVAISDSAHGVHFESSFKQRTPYTSASACLPAGQCYNSALHLGSASHRGVQAGIPQCGVYLAPLSPQQTFCVAAPVNSVSDPYPDDDAASVSMTTNSKIPIFSEQTCQSNCSLDAHFLLPLTLSEINGAGWTSGYYAILSQARTGGSSNSNPPIFSTAGTMEWGFEELQHACVPAVKQCYYVQLSVPTGLDEEYPTIDFLNATLLHGTTTTSRSTPCPYSVNASQSLASFCIDPSTTSSANGVNNVVVTFYKQNSLADLGQVSVNWKDYYYVTSTAREIGRCTAPVIYSPRTTSTDSNIDLFDNMDYSCLDDCTRDSSSSTSSIFADVNETCDFLSAVYNLCDSYSIASGLCNVPACASDCKPEVYCYFGAGMATSCPYTGDSSGSIWNGKSADSAVEIANQCIHSYKDSSNTASTSNSAVATALIGKLYIEYQSRYVLLTFAFIYMCSLVVSVIAFLLLLFFIGPYLFKHLQMGLSHRDHQRLPLQSEDRSFLRRGSTTILTQDTDNQDIEEPTTTTSRGSEGSNSATSNKNNPSSWNKSSNSASSTITSASGNSSRKNKIGKYEMVPLHTEDYLEEESVHTTSTTSTAVHNPVHSNISDVGMAGTEAAFRIAEDDDDEMEVDDHMKKDSVTAVHMARSILLENDLHDHHTTGNTNTTNDVLHGKDIHSLREALYNSLDEHNSDVHISKNDRDKDSDEGELL